MSLTVHDHIAQWCENNKGYIGINIIVALPISINSIMLINGQQITKYLQT